MEDTEKETDDEDDFEPVGPIPKRVTKFNVSTKVVAEGQCPSGLDLR